MYGSNEVSQCMVLIRGHKCPRGKNKENYL